MKNTEQQKRDYLYFNSFGVMHQIEMTMIKAGTTCESCLQQAKEDLQTIFSDNEHTDHDTLKKITEEFLLGKIKELGVEKVKATVEA
jgi:formate-dependent nitrite reductase cytochrome c552 subunit